MPATFIEASRSTVSSPQDVQVPAGSQAGDLAIVHVTSDLSLNPVAGWAGPNSVHAGNDFFTGTYTRTLTSPTDTFAKGLDSGCSVAVFRGAGIAIEAESSVVQGSSSPSVTSSGADRLLVSVFAISAGTTVLTAPSGMTRQYHQDPYFQHGLATQVVGAGATGTRTWSSSQGGSQATAGALLLKVDQPPSAPGVPSITPDPVNTTGTISWAASTDPDGDPVQYWVDLSTDNGATWTRILNGVQGTSVAYDFTNVAATTAARVRVLAGRNPDLGVYSAWTVGPTFTVQHNTAPTAPTPTSPVGGATVDRNGTIRLAATYNDPDLPNDSVSESQWRWRKTGTTTWTTVTQTNNLRYYDIAGGTLAAGDYEWQALYKDAAGLTSPWSASEFFTAATPPDGPNVTDPADGATVPQNTVIAWASADQAAFRVRRVADSAGTPDVATVYYDSGIVENATARNHPLTFETNNRYEHVQLQVRSAAGLWSAWVSRRVLVSYTPPATPTLGALGDDTTASITVTIANPAPAIGQPTVTSHEVWRRAGTSGDGIRIARNIPPGGRWTDYTPASGVQYQYKARSYGTNGTTAESAWTA